MDVSRTVRIFGVCFFPCVVGEDRIRNQEEYWDILEIVLQLLKALIESSDPETEENIEREEESERERDSVCSRESRNRG